MCAAFGCYLTAGTNSLLNILPCMKDHSHEKTTWIQQSLKYLCLLIKQREDKYNTEILLLRQDPSGSPDSTKVLQNITGAARLMHTPPNKSHTSTTQQILDYLDFVQLLVHILYPRFNFPSLRKAETGHCASVPFMTQVEQI